MSSQKYQPLKDVDVSEANHVSSTDLQNTSNNVEHLPIIEANDLPSDSDDEPELGPKSPSTPPTLDLQPHPLQILPTIEIFQTPNPLNNPDEEEKPEPILPRVLGLGNDGVFANLAAKPVRETTRETILGSGLPPSFSSVADGETNPAGPLPDYDEAMQEPSPPHFDDAIAHPTSLSGLQIEDLLVEGLPVGGILSFAWNVLVSRLFQIIGFLLTYLLHINHAGRLGSIAGLGITLLNYGLNLRYKIRNPDSSDGQDESDFSFILGKKGEETPDSAIWVAYILMLVGCIVALKSVVEYVRLRKERSAMLRSPEVGTTQ